MSFGRDRRSEQGEEKESEFGICSIYRIYLA